MSSKERLDILLTELHLVESREKAKRVIMAGDVWVDNERVDKPGTKVERDANIHLKSDTLRYVSRGGLKLEGAFAYFGFSMSDTVICDIGASTGGFVDCALQNGARKVYAVDVGYGQLAWTLRIDPRVINIERTNARYLERDDFPEPMDWVTTDVSFISLEKIIPVAWKILKEDGSMLALIKPQFEAGKEQVGKNGVVRDPKVHIEVLDRIIAFAQETGFGIKGLTFSPVQGPKGNIEYLCWLSKSKFTENKIYDTNALVETTFLHFKKDA